MAKERPPALDYLVFGLALLLAIILAYYGFQSWWTGATPTPAGWNASEQAPAKTPARAPDQLRHSGTVEGVSHLPDLGGSQTR
ncbi:MAG: hypothetical protein KGO96_01910 [Elusimicrobia bacterium]|nr:hypothetical protein [Elusimicrobiota bacterium]MDE2424650.1 hypothetical protein [Elusimicrobiota bacterium]